MVNIKSNIYHCQTTGLGLTALSGGMEIFKSRLLCEIQPNKIQQLKDYFYDLRFKKIYPKLISDSEKLFLELIDD